LIIRDLVSSERFAHAYHVTSAREDDTFALDVLANILFEGKSSRAHRKLVDELDLALDISGSAFTPTFPGLFIVTAMMKQKVSGEKVEEVLSEIIRDVQENGVKSEEIEAAVKQLTVQMVDTVRTPFGIGQLMGTVQVVLGDPKYFAEDLGKYLKVKVPDVQRVAKKYLTPNNRSAVRMVMQSNKAVVSNK
jgi:predicted Zn-dependent peptidase